MTYCSPLFGKRRFIKRCPPFIGIDDFAFRKGHSYGTIICDLSTHKPVALLPERYPETISEWLKNHQNIQVVSRDGYQAFRKGIQNASQSILQVYDRWHFVRAVKKQIDACLTSILPSVITLEKEETDQQTFPHETKLQRKQKERAEKKWMMIKSIQQEYKKGKKKVELAREFHMDPRTISKYLNITEMPVQVKRKRKRQTDGFEQYIQQLEQEGKTIREIDAQLRKYGYTGTLSGVRVAVESIRKERKRQGIKESSVRISRRQMISYVWKRKSRLLEKELQLLEQSFKMYPSLHSFHQMVQTFREAFDERNYPAFFKWLEKQLSSPNNHLYDCALRLRRDLQSIKLAFSTSYSNGVVEGHVHRLKLMKRIMYGRAKLDLLEKRVLYHL